MEPLRHHFVPTSEQYMTSEYNKSYNATLSTRYKIWAVPHTVRISIRIISLLVATSLLGLLAHASTVWFTTRNVVQQQPNGIRQRAWPVHIDVWPIWVMLGAAAIAVFIQIVSLLTLYGPVRRLRDSKLHNWAVFFSSVIAIVAWIAAAIYFKLQDTKGKKNWDLWSWSCSHKSLKNGKISFETMCIEMNYTFYASIIITVLEIASLVIFGCLLHLTRKHYRVITVDTI